MSMEWIRKHYRIDVQRGSRVLYTGEDVTRSGTVVGSEGAYLRVRFDDEIGMKRTRLLHPTWRLSLISTEWSAVQQEQMTVEEIAKKQCVRCFAPAVHQWSVCADGNNWRPLCIECDIAVNELVLKFMRHPNTKQLIQSYSAEQRGENYGDA